MKEQLKKYFAFSKNPEENWKVIFFVTVTLVFLVSVLNIYMFVKVNKGELFVVEEVSERMKMPDLDTLRQTLSYYHGKAANLENILSGGATQVTDPSI